MELSNTDRALRSMCWGIPLALCHMRTIAMRSILISEFTICDADDEDDLRETRY